MTPAQTDYVGLATLSREPWLHSEPTTEVAMMGAMAMLGSIKLKK